MVSAWFLLVALATISLRSLSCSAKNDESYIQYKTIYFQSQCNVQRGGAKCTGWWGGKRCWTEYYCTYRQVTGAAMEIKYRCKLGWTPYPTCDIPICTMPCNTGFTCTAPNTCTDNNECALNQHQCQHYCYNTPGGYECKCKGGYALNPDKKTCSDTNDCTDGTHQCQQTCHNTVGSYECSCKIGYKLASNEKSCNDIDECRSESKRCEHRCINTVGSFTCGCNSGYKLMSDGFHCKDINECETLNGGCEHECTNIDGTFQCSCRSGFILDSDQRSCSKEKTTNTETKANTGDTRISDEKEEIENIRRELDALL